MKFMLVTHIFFEIPPQEGPAKRMTSRVAFQAFDRRESAQQVANDLKQEWAHQGVHAVARIYDLSKPGAPPDKY